MKTNVLSGSNRLSVSSYSVKTCLSAGIGLFLAAAAPALMATNYFFDNFDSGVSGSTWAAVAGANTFVLDGDNAHTFGGSAGSAKQVNADPFIYYMQIGRASRRGRGDVCL